MGHFEVVDTYTGDIKAGPFKRLRDAVRNAEGWESSYSGRIAVYATSTGKTLDVDTGIWE